VAWPGGAGGYNPCVKVLLVAADPRVREAMALITRGVERTTGEEVETLEAADGLGGIRLAWRERPEVVMADEITSRAGAFALARDLKGADPPFPGKVVILLDRPEDEWLARWSGADAWFVKPVSPFEVADTISGLLGRGREAGRVAG
jgi:DNA-binding NarL/FixJ family response regulator